MVTGRFQCLWSQSYRYFGWTRRIQNHQSLQKCHSRQSCSCWIRLLTINLNPVWTFCGTLLLQCDHPKAAKFFYQVQLVNNVSFHNGTTAYCECAAIQSTYSLCREFRPLNVPANISDMLLPCKSLSKEQILSLVLLFVTKREEKK